MFEDDYSDKSWSWRFSQLMIVFYILYWVIVIITVKNREKKKKPLQQRAFSSSYQVPHPYGQQKKNPQPSLETSISFSLATRPLQDKNQSSSSPRLGRKNKKNSEQGYEMQMSERRLFSEGTMRYVYVYRGTSLCFRLACRMRELLVTGTPPRGNEKERENGLIGFSRLLRVRERERARREFQVPRECFYCMLAALIACGLI